jgi:lysophospholipase L1-like esterase
LVHPILFVGSSSFRKWDKLAQSFPGYPVLNRGFGGSTLVDVIRYADDIIFPYAPKQVVIYCGENDLASSETVTANVVFKRFVTLFGLIRKKLPNASIEFVSIKPSPSRKNIQAKVIVANKLIKDFIKKQSKTDFIDVYYPMLNPDGSMRKELYLEDDLHMTATGYSIWQKIITPYLLKK